MPHRAVESGRAGSREVLARAVETAVPVTHPTEPGISGVYGTVFTGVAEGAEADLRNVTVFGDQQVDRSLTVDQAQHLDPLGEPGLADLAR